MKNQNNNHSPWMSHRGVKTKHPENTMGAYGSATNAGFGAIELDVVMSKDKTLYCSHNHDLERETDGFGYIYDLGDREIDGCFAIHPKTGLREKIPKLDAVLAELPKDLFINIEIKSRKFFELEIAVRTANLIKTHRRETQSMVSSFNPFILRVVRLINKNIRTGYLIKALPPMLLYPLSGANNVHPRADILNKGLIQYCNKRQIDIIPWTVNISPARDHLVAKGIDSIISDERRLLSSET